MDIFEHADELIGKIHNQLGEYERTLDGSVERIHHELEEYTRAAEEQIERIQNEIEQESEAAEEQVRRLHEELEERHRNVEEQVQKLHDEAEGYERNIAEQVERINEQLEHARENADEQVERIREQIEHKSDSVEEQIDRMREQVDDYRDKSEDWVEGIRERMEELRDGFEHRSENIHVESETWIESKSDPDTVQSLIDRFHSLYSERHAAITIHNTYAINGVEILKYSGKLLPLADMDARYPRREWLQTLLNKNVTIENIDDYCRYLNARDMLMRIQNKPDVWTSGLFDIPPTENWETYQEAYIDQLANPEKAPTA